MGRLKGVPKILSPDLLHAIASMGHGDEIVLADANFPAASTASEGARLIDASGHGIPDLLEAILQFFPLDTFVSNPVVLMDLVNSDKKKGMICLSGTNIRKFVTKLKIGTSGWTKWNGLNFINELNRLMPS